MKWAIYQTNIGDSYDPSYEMKVASAESYDALAVIIPTTATNIHLCDTEPKPAVLKWSLDLAKKK